ncbi:MAG: hypothetical protein SVV03_06280 [Candidatus Nanohaloarchaea archaeon]|nr:hypothetical protein [Candidatus Nanohaloarchaea archaeon]
MEGRKGQYGVIEQVMIFGFGIAIAVGFLLAFEAFGADAKSQALEDQREILADWTASHVVQLVNTGGKGSLTFSLPESIADEDYIIEFGDSGVSVTAGGGSYSSTDLNGLEDKYRFEGEVSGDFETATIRFTGESVIIEGS